MVFHGEKLPAVAAAAAEQPPRAALHGPPSPWAPRKVRRLHFLTFSLSVWLNLFDGMFDQVPNLVKCWSLVGSESLGSACWAATCDGKYWAFGSMHKLFHTNQTMKKLGLNDLLRVILQVSPAYNAPLLFREEGPVFPHERPHGASQLKSIVSELCHRVQYLHNALQ